MSAALKGTVKLPHFRLLRGDVRSLDAQVVLELIAGAMVTAVLLRWFM